MIRVLIEQELIPIYRVPFFEGLSKIFEILVLASDEVNVPGVTDVKNNLPFPTHRSPVKRTLFFNQRHHIDIFDVLNEFKPEIYISGGMPAAYYKDPFLFLKYKKYSLCHSLIHWGCDGYSVKDFMEFKAKNKQLLLRNPARYFLNKCYCRYVKRVDKFLAYSEHTAKYWQEVFNVPNNKTTITYNSIDVSPFVDFRRNYEKEGKKRNIKRLIFVGRLTKGKAVDVLLSAYKQIKLLFPNISLQIVGDGPELTTLKSIVEMEGLIDVTFLGEIFNSKELSQVMYEASLFILPGLGGLGINTAMAMGLPIICSRADGTEQHLVINDKNGIIFDGTSEDLVRAIKSLLIKDDVIREMGLYSSKLIDERYNLNKMIDVFVNTIECLTKATRAQSVSGKRG